MKQSIVHFRSMRVACTVLLVTVICFFCGLTAHAADLEAQPSYSENVVSELYPYDVQTIVQNGTRYIVKAYNLTPEQSAADIPRDSFEQDGWEYTLADITERRTSKLDSRSHTEIVEISTDSNDINEIIALLAPTLEYQSEDGYCGLLSLELATVSCEAAGYQNSSFIVSTTREYPHLSTNDLALIPKTTTENGRTLELEDVTWEVQNYVNVDHEDIPDSYRAVAQYTARASKSVVTGYITTAEYTGEITKAITGDTIYIAYFNGTALMEPDALKTNTGNSAPAILPILIASAVLGIIAGTLAFILLRNNVKIYSVREEGRALVAKHRLTLKQLSIDLTPLVDFERARYFSLEIDQMAAKRLNGKTLEIIYGPAKLNHTIAFEGVTYIIEANFHEGTIKT